MNIILEILGIPRYGGARTAAMGWVIALAQYGPHHHFTVLVNQPEPELSNFPNVEQVVISVSGRLLPRLYLQAWLPFYVQQKRVKIVHFLRNLAVMVPNAQVLVNINDLTRLFFPHMFAQTDIWYWRMVQRRVLPRAQRLICISNHTRHDVCEWLPHYPPEHIITIYPAIAPQYHPLPPQTTQAVRAKYQLPTPFILYVGGLARHKNVRTLVQAFIKLKQTTHLPHSLVIVGGQYHTHNDVEVMTLAQTLPPGQIIFTGVVTEEDLPALYSAATLFIFPSLYEGFGLAPLEAMACGTPVIAARSGSLPEVLGQAAYWLDQPYDVVNLTNAMHLLLQDQSYHERLCQRGLDQSQLFSWQKTAQQTLDLYQKLP